jgi:hypothetical protein
MIVFARDADAQTIARFFKGFDKLFGIPGPFPSNLRDRRFRKKPHHRLDNNQDSKKLRRLESRVRQAAF